MLCFSHQVVYRHYKTSSFINGHIVLYVVVLFRDVVFSHIPSLLPSNTVFIQFNITSPLLLLCNGDEGLLIDNRFVMSLIQILISRLAMRIAAHMGS